MASDNVLEVCSPLRFPERGEVNNLPSMFNIVCCLINDLLYGQILTLSSFTAGYFHVSFTLKSSNFLRNYARTGNDIYRYMVKPLV